MQKGERWALPVVALAALGVWGAAGGSRPVPEASAPIRFEIAPIGFRLEHGEIRPRRVPATMAGGLAIFD